MTRTGYHYKEWDAESGVANLIEYLMISAVIMALLMVMLLLVNTNIMENPANQIVYVEFTDIGNGISTRMVDVYAIAPKNGTMSTKFDIPNEIVGKDYAVNILGSQSDQNVTVYRGSMSSTTSLAGIGASMRGTANGSTTGAGLNVISYDSKGGL